MAEGNSTEHLSDSSNLGSNSFIILGSGSYDSMLNNELVQETFKQDFVNISEDDSSENLKKLEEKKMANDNELIPKKSCDVNLQEKLNQLLKENCHLKETLNQNNLAMRTQLSTFCIWQQEVLKTHETHMQKFSETKDLVLRLRAENLELKKQLNNSSYSSWPDSIQNFEKLEANNLVEPKVCLKCIEKDQEYGKMQDLYHMEVKKNESLIIEKNGLEKINKESKEDLLKCNNDLEDLKKLNDILRQKIVEQSKNFVESFSTGLLPNCEARIQINNLLKELEKERAKVSNLTEEVEKFKSQNKITPVDKIPTEELTEYISELNNIDESFKKQSQRINGLSTWIYLSEENLLKSSFIAEKDDDKITSEVVKQTSQLNNEDLNCKENETSQDVHEQYNKLLKDYQCLQEELNNVKVNETALNELKTNIESLNEELKKKDEIICGKDEELNILKKTVKDLTLECEEVAILKVQVELYRSDFNDERAAREKLVGEKEELEEQIRLLKTMKNEEKGSENSEQDSSLDLQSLPSKGKKKKYICPKCMFSFSELNRCQEHIEDCINIHFYP